MNAWKRGSPIDLPAPPGVTEVAYTRPASRAPSCLYVECTRRHHVYSSLQGHTCNSVVRYVETDTLLPGRPGVVLYTDGAEEKRRARHKAAIAIELASGGSGCYHHSPTPIN
jgi:hypothetical protein